MIIGIDASRNRSWGAVNHIVGILTNFNSEEHDIKSIHLWSYQNLLDKIPDYSWLTKHSPSYLNRNILFQMLWQRYILPREAKRYSCDIMFDSDAGSISAFKPYVSLSQDLLTFEDNSLKFYKFGISKLRLICLYFIQLASFKNANGVIFLTEYTKKKIIEHTGSIKNSIVIPHGIDDKFNVSVKLRKDLNNNIIKCNYVSPFLEYKNHKHVIEAIRILLKKGYDIQLELFGDNETIFGKSIMSWIESNEFDSSFVKIRGNIQHDSLPKCISDSDICIFASSVETISITLMEYMKIGLPIACSNKGPMPEVLQDGGVYFDPLNSVSIAEALEKIIQDNQLRFKIANRAKMISEEFSWKKCSKDTFTFIENIFKLSKN